MGERLIEPHDVYGVLFLQAQGNNEFRRIGVGRVVDERIIKGFGDAQDQELMLI
jgi:hypothetical protein